MIDQHMKDEIRHAVAMYVEYAPNSHLGHCSPREDIRSAFRMIRSWAVGTGDLMTGIRQCETTAYSYSDM